MQAVNLDEGGSFTCFLLDICIRGHHPVYYRAMSPANRCSTPQGLIVFVNPLSVDNLALYDASLINGLKDAGCLAQLEYFGNLRCRQSFSGRLTFHPQYSYCGRSLPGKVASYLFSQIRLIIRLNRLKPEVVHFQWFRLLPADLTMIRVLRALLPGCRFVFTAHNVLPHEETRWSQSLWKRMYRHFNSIIVHEEEAARMLRDELGVPLETVHVIPHGLLRFPRNEVKLSEETSSMAARIRRRANPGNPDAPVLSFLGYLRHYKGLDILAEALEDSGLRSRFKILVAGDGTSDAAEQMAEWPECWVNNRKLSEYEFLASLKASDLVVLPYRSISQSGLLLTAVAEGVPVLASPSGGMKDAVDRYNAGWVLEENTPRALAEALLKLVDGEALMNRRVEPITSEDVSAEWRDIGTDTMELYGLEPGTYTKQHGAAE